MSLTIIAKVKKILPPQNFVSKKDGQPKVKHGFVVETQEQYPKLIHMTSWGGTFDANTLQVDATYNFYIDIASREYNERWYTDIQCWKVELVEGQAPVPVMGTAHAPASSASPLPPPPPQGISKDDPPF